MNENEKQAIEEMARDLCACYVDHTSTFDPKATAEKMTAKDYRKQEWISVEDRLPETETPVLIFTKKGTYYVGYYYKGVVNPGLTGFYADSCKRVVTHWMPLPEAPKGGA